MQPSPHPNVGRQLHCENSTCADHRRALRTQATPADLTNRVPHGGGFIYRAVGTLTSLRVHVTVRNLRLICPAENGKNRLFRLRCCSVADHRLLWLAMSDA